MLSHILSFTDRMGDTGEARSILPTVQLGPRDVIIDKADTGFGFNVRGQVCSLLCI